MCSGTLGRGAARRYPAIVGAGRTTAELMGSSKIDDVSDPYGGPQRGYDASAVVIDELVTVLAQLLAPAVPS